MFYNISKYVRMKREISHKVFKYLYLNTIICKIIRGIILCKKKIMSILKKWR